MIPVLKKERKKKKNIVAEKSRINTLTYRHLLIKYHLATVGAEFGPVADESFDNKEAPLDMGFHPLPAAPERKFLVHARLLRRKSNNGIT